MKKLMLIFVSVMLMMSCDHGTSPEGGTDPIVSTIKGIRMGSVALGAEVTINDVIVTSNVGAGGRGFFVQDSLETSNGGIMIYATNNAGLSVAIGDTLSITGKYQEYFGQSQIAVEDVSKIAKTGAASLPPPIVTSIGEISSGTNSEKLESMLIKIENAKVTEVNASERTWALDGYLVVDDYLYSPTDLPAIDDTFSAVVGIVYYSYGKYRLEPRYAADLVSAG